jgi:LysR family hydrogen peroxide-inducible transcriptional activator
MNLRDLRYLLAVAEHGHFGRAAEACSISQPTLSVQVRKLEELLGVALFERTSKAVTPTAACERLIGHVRAAVAEADAILAVARNLRDPLAGRFRLGVIPTLAPYLLPLVFAPLREELPTLEVEPWEDQTAALLERLRAHELDAALLATEVDGPDLASQPVFAEPFLAALPPGHPLAAREVVAEEQLAEDILVLADGHCLREQALAACGRSGVLVGGRLRAASLSTLLNMVAAGYGTTLIPGLAAGAAQDAGIVLRPLAAQAGRTVRIAWRTRFPRRAAVEAMGEVIAKRLRGFAAGGGGGDHLGFGSAGMRAAAPLPHNAPPLSTRSPPGPARPAPLRSPLDCHLAYRGVPPLSRRC